MTINNNLYILPKCGDDERSGGSVDSQQSAKSGVQLKVLRLVVKLQIYSTLDRLITWPLHLTFFIFDIHKDFLNFQLFFFVNRICLSEM